MTNKREQIAKKIEENGKVYLDNVFELADQILSLFPDTPKVTEEEDKYKQALLDIGKRIGSSVVMSHAPEIVKKEIEQIKNDISKIIEAQDKLGRLFCSKCGKIRSNKNRKTSFTICEECFDKMQGCISLTKTKIEKLKKLGAGDIDACFSNEDLGNKINEIIDHVNKGD